MSLLPTLLWSGGPDSAPSLRKAGITEIAVTRDVGAWSSTGIRAKLIDESTLVRLDKIGVDYQVGQAGATSAPWVESNLWRMIRQPDRSFLYDVPADALPLAVAEAYAGGARTYFRVQPADLERFAAAYRFLHGLNGPPLPARVNFTLIDDRSAVMDEVMNLLARRNLLFDVDTAPRESRRMQVKVGAPGYPKASADDPYIFAAVVRDRIGDDHRLVRVFGSDTVLFRLYGDARHARVHLLRYGRGGQGLRVRVLGRYSRVYLSDYGRNCERAADVAIDDKATEFTIPEMGPFAVVDLEAPANDALHSKRADVDVPLTADPESEFWKAAPSVSAANDTFGVRVPLPTMTVHSRWTADALYLLYICPFQQLHLKPNPTTTAETPSLWNWDVAEAFIGDKTLGPNRYREFEISPQGEWVDLDIRCEKGQSEHDLAWDAGMKAVSRIDRGRKIWYGAMRIPWSSIRPGAPNAGDKFSLNLYRTSGPPPATKYVSWQPTDHLTFHVPESFGSLVLE